jgi:hypothetical protein
MEMTTIELKKITAAEGYVLTNGDVYSKEIYLGVNDSPSNWYEITEEEYEEILAKEEEEFLL